MCTCSGNVKRILKGPFLFNATIYVFFFLDPLFKYKRLMFGCIANLKLLYIIIESNVFNPHFILWVVLGFYVYIISLAKPCLRS